MSRKKALEGGTREKILTTAMQVFMENGYEKTSVRMILEKADIVTGSFYHFFASKEELFEEVIAQYLTRYQSNVIKITDMESVNFIDKVKSVLNTTQESTEFYYQNLEAQRLHWTIQYALHKKTLMAILPQVEKMVDKEIRENRASNPMHMDAHTLSVVVLQGMEGILHAKSMGEADEKQITLEQVEKMKKDVIAYIILVMGLEVEE